jgi:transcriptional regulator with XRE-family HTH domain
MFMTSSSLAPISEEALDEQWFSLRFKTWRAVKKAVKSMAVEQKLLADRIRMDPAQFSRVIMGNTSNVTLRTLHNIARAANHRLKITLEPLAGLPKPNYSYEEAKRERLSRIVKETPLLGEWNSEGKPGSSETRRLETITAG